VPLVVDEDGRRLAKRDAQTHLGGYRAAGVHPFRIVGLLGYWCGVSDRRVEMTAGEFRQRFDVARLSRSAVRFTGDDHTWLMQGRR